MIESPVLREPGSEGVFEPNTSTVGVSFRIHDDVEYLLRPTARTWQQAYRVLHELAHFYQFYTTSWGLLHQMLGRAEFLLVSGFLNEYADGSSQARLPLLDVGLSTAPLPEAFERNDPRALLRCAHLLEGLRRHVFGYELAPEGPILREGEEWRWLVNFLYEAFGIPKVIIWSRDDTRLAHGYRIDDLLESHAHALSSLWMLQAAERYHLDEEIREGVMRVGNRYASGPYGSLLRFASQLPVADQMQLSMFCVICDLALNLLDPRLPLGLLANPAAESHVAAQAFDPVSNTLDLISGVIDGRYPTLGRRDSIDTVVGPFLEGLASMPLAEELLTVSVAAAHLTRGGPSLDETRSSPLVASLRSEVDRELLNTVSLDIVGSFAAVNRVRREHQPLVLGGIMIEDLVMLLSTVGLPSFLSHVGAGSSDARPAFRVLNGLSLLDQAQQADSRRTGWRAVKTDIEVVSTLRTLLVSTRDEMAGEAETFGMGSLKPSAVLASWWGLHIDDFE